MCNNRTSLSQHDCRNDIAIPKAIRKFRIPPEDSPLLPSAMTSVIPSRNATFLQSLVVGTEIVDDRTQSMAGSLNDGILVNIVSGGCTRGALVSGSLDMTWSVWSVDVRPFEDPNHDPNLRAHLGRHVGRAGFATRARSSS